MTPVQKRVRRLPSGFLAGLVAIAPLLPPVLAGCMTDDGTPTSIDPFPKPLGEALIPLLQEYNATYRYAEFDTAGKEVLREDLPLRVYPMGPRGVYAYAFEAGTSGILLEQRDADGNRDSAGVYIVGRFRNDSTFLDSVPVLWLPQMPDPGGAWPLSASRTTELVSADTAFWAEALPGMEPDPKSPVRAGMQRHPTLLFKETAGDTLTFYHFRRGMGCVGFSRSVNGRLLAAGSLFAFYKPAAW